MEEKEQGGGEKEGEERKRSGRKEGGGGSWQQVPSPFCHVSTVEPNMVGLVLGFRTGDRGRFPGGHHPEPRAPPEWIRGAGMATQAEDSPGRRATDTN